MKVIYDKYRLIIGSFLRNEKTFLVLLILVAIAAYGFTLTNFSIGKDDIFYISDYYDRSVPFFNGRWSQAIFDALFGNWQAQPFFGDFIAILLLLAATINWTILLKEASCNKLRRTELISFALVFISYPLINEIFIYAGHNFNIGLGYLLTGMALIFSYEFFLKDASSWLFLLALAFLLIAIALYESFAAVYFCGIFITLILTFLFNEGLKRDKSVYFSALIKYIFTLFAAVALKMIISKLINSLLHITAVSGLANEITWLNDKLTVFEQFTKLLKEIAYYYFYNGIFYQPIRSFAASCMLAVFFAIVIQKRYKSFIPVLLIIGALLSNFFISMIQGIATPYRACQSFGIFIAFIVLFSFIILRSHPRKLFIMNVILFFFVYWQARDLSLWFYNDYHRFELDRINFLTVGRDFEKLYGKTVEKPVVFLGRPPRYNNLRGDMVSPMLAWLPKPVPTSQTNGTSLFRNASDYRDFYLFFEYHGFKFLRANENYTLRAMNLTKDHYIPVYPKDGYIKEFPELIVVKLGEQ